jgi:hypothetical protein
VRAASRDRVHDVARGEYAFQLAFVDDDEAVGGLAIQLPGGLAQCRRGGDAGEAAIHDDADFHRRGCVRKIAIRHNACDALPFDDDQMMHAASGKGRRGRRDVTVGRNSYNWTGHHFVNTHDEYLLTNEPAWER